MRTRTRRLGSHWETRRTVHGYTPTRKTDVLHPHTCLHWQVIPEMFKYVTYPLTCLIKLLWMKHEPLLKEGYVMNPFKLEMVVMLEHALNYAHMGSTRVLTRTLDCPWLGLSVVNDRLPCISSSFIQLGSLSLVLITI